MRVLHYAACALGAPKAATFSLYLLFTRGKFLAQFVMNILCNKHFSYSATVASETTARELVNEANNEVSVAKVAQAW